MNSVQIVGRMTRDIEIKNSQNGKLYGRFTIAVNRFSRATGEQQQADFIPCIAWEKTAEMIQKYIHKGDRIGIIGQLHIDNTEINGEKKSFTSVSVREIDFLQDKRGTQEKETEKNDDGFPF